MTDASLGKTLPRMEVAYSGGKTLQLPDDLCSGWTLLYFYPKDDTPGCTAQACSYRDKLADFQAEDIAIFGVSMDPLDSHDQFSGKFQLNFPLIADTKAELSTALDVYGDQEWKGQVFKGLSRDSFLIGPGGVVKKVWRKVNPQTTVSETLAQAKAVKAEQ